MKPVSNTRQALIWIVLLLSTPVVLYYFLHRLHRPFGDSALFMMLIAPAIWLFLLLVKKDDHELLRLLLNPTSVAEWLLYVTGLAAGSLGVLSTYHGPVLMTGLVLEANGAGCGMIKGWIKRQLGMEEPEPPSENWWPAKRD